MKIDNAECSLLLGVFVCISYLIMQVSASAVLSQAEVELLPVDDDYMLHVMSSVQNEGDWA